MEVAGDPRGQGPLMAGPDVGRFAALGIDAKDVAEWMAAGFGPFEAAVAHGDGFTPSIAVHCRHQLSRIARSWALEGLDSAEGLRWHRAGFAAKEATRWRSEGMDVEAARARRAGYDGGASIQGDGAARRGNPGATVNEEGRGASSSEGRGAR